MNLCKRLFFLNGLLKYLVIFIIEVDFFQHLAIFINVMLRTFLIFIFYFLFLFFFK